MSGVILAELELFHSRPLAPTRRLSVGYTTLPADPAPGAGGVLLGGIMATVAGHFDPDLEADLLRLSIAVEEGRRIVQPRLRHRLQTDRVGLARSVFTLRAAADGTPEFDFEATSCTPLQGAVASVYAVATMEASVRPVVMDSVRRGLRWYGDVGPELISVLSGSAAQIPLAPGALADPLGWACDVFGFDDREPSRKDVQQAFRGALRDCHPDHGGGDDNAAERIAELTEARRILLAR